MGERSSGAQQQKKTPALANGSCKVKGDFVFFFPDGVQWVLGSGVFFAFIGSLAHLSVHLFICSFVHLFIYFFIYLFIYLLGAAIFFFKLDGQFHVFGKDGDPLGMDGHQVGAIKRPDQVGLCGRLQCPQCLRRYAHVWF